MKKYGILCALALAGAMQVSAATLVYVAGLNGLSEVPPNASPGTGNAVVTFDTVAHTMRVQVDFSGLIGVTTAAHIHCCTTDPFAGTAGVATTVPNFTGFPLGVTSGTYDQTFDLTADSSYNTGGAFFTTVGGGTAAGAEAALLANAAAGKTYLNIHSEFAGGGEIRGFLVAVPEPATFVFTGIGLAGALLARKRLARR